LVVSVNRTAPCGVDKVLLERRLSGRMATAHMRGGLMKSARTTAAVTAGLLVLAIVASPVSAGEPPPTGTITVEPTSGPAGFVFTFSGEGCVSENGPGVVDLFVFFGEDLITNPDPAFVEPDEDGNWSFGIVPNGFFSTNAEAAGIWDVTATCFDAETDQVLVDYEPATFEVTAPPTPPTTEPPTPPITVPETPQAPPAAPVPAEPSFTG
jgi:hypothetical protein